MNKLELVNFSNERNGSLGPKFSSYENYLEWQMVKGRSFESYYEKYLEGQKRYINENFSNLDRTSKIADISCGDGIGLSFFLEMGFENLYGFEYEDDKINLAKSRGARVVKQDICSDSFDTEFFDFFDVIYSSHSLEHVLNPLYTIKNMMDILKKGGLLYIVVPYPNTICSDITHEHGYMVHCGSMPLGLHISDEANTTETLISSLGLELVSKKFDSFRESEVWFTFRKV